jgi:DNA-binding transcriptional LysR family regulator
MQWSERIGRRLKLRDLHILLAVVQHRSMAKAASELAISQPAISKAIADLEHTIGLRLLDRSRLGIEATEYGRALVRRAIAIFDELKQGVKELEYLADPAVGELRIGTSESMAAGILPVILHQFSRRYPRVRVHVAQVVFAPTQYRELRDRKSTCCSDGYRLRIAKKISSRRCCLRTGSSLLRGSIADGHGHAG